MTQKQLFSRYIHQLPEGELCWIGLRPARKQPVVATASAEALENVGLVGDHRCDKTPGSARQVTVIAKEWIDLIAHYSGHGMIDPVLLRRNLVVKGINLNALRHQRFRIGSATFEATALCHPCSRMDSALGVGGAASMLGYGGLCAKITQSGIITVGDALIPLPPE